MQRVCGSKWVQEQVINSMLFGTIGEGDRTQSLVCDRLLLRLRWFDAALFQLTLFCCSLSFYLT
jgi:hypothetical protein